MSGDEPFVILQSRSAPTPENPPAFPAAWTERNEYGLEFPFVQPGMTLRDHFAAQAVPGLLNSEHMRGCFAAEGNGKTWERELAMVSYRIADSMLAERAMTDADVLERALKRAGAK